MVNDFEVIHMGGRTYNPTLGRFMQADPFIQAPGNLQSYNRYAYVQNNPMSYTDPSGYFLKKMMQLTGTTAVMKFLAKNPLLNTIAQIVVAYYGGPLGVALFNFAQTYAVTGSLGGGLRAGAFAAAGAGAGIGALGSFGGLAGFVASGIAGGALSVLQGGKFGHGFVSAGLGASLGGLGGRVGNPYGQVLVSAVIGGTISKVTGGKFINGAGSAAFAAALRADWGGKVNHDHNELNQDPDEKTIKDGVNKNNSLNLEVSEDGKTLSGEISIYCKGADMEACSGVGLAMSKINQTIDGKTLSLTIRATRWKFLADLTVSWRDFDSKTDLGIQYSDNIAFKFGVGFVNGAHPLTAAHELGHFIGLDHQWNSTKSLMSYSSSKGHNLTPVQMNNLFEAYGK